MRPRPVGKVVAVDVHGGGEPVVVASAAVAHLLVASESCALCLFLPRAFVLSPPSLASV